MNMTISIRIPVYNQPHLLVRCLKSIEIQTVLPNEIIIIDDFSSIDYLPVVDQFSSLNIKYLKNTKNLGALPNMLNALYYESNTKYKAVFHEDDVMQPQYIEYSIYALENNPDTIFCCSLISFYKENEDIEFKSIQYKAPKRINHMQLVKTFLQGKTIGFGSIVYKSASLKPILFDFESYSVFGDRPFLVNLLGDNGFGVLIESELSLVYDHSHQDNRWQSLIQKHAFNLYTFYKSILEGKSENIDKIGLTHGLIDAYKLIPKKNKNIKLFYYYKAYCKGLVSVKYLLLSIRIIRKSIEKLKFR